MAKQQFPENVEQAFQSFEDALRRMARAVGGGVQEEDAVTAFRSCIDLAREVGRNERDDTSDQIRQVLEEYANPEYFIR